MIKIQPALNQHRSSDCSRPSFKSEDDFEDLRTSHYEMRQMAIDKNSPRIVSAIAKGGVVLAGAILGAATMKMGLENSLKILSKFAQNASVKSIKSHIVNILKIGKNAIKSVLKFAKKMLKKGFDKFVHLPFVQTIDRKLRISKTIAKINANPVFVKYKAKAQDSLLKLKNEIKSRIPNSTQVKDGVIATTSGASGVAAGAKTMAEYDEHSQKHKNTFEDEFEAVN